MAKAGSGHNPGAASEADVIRGQQLKRTRSGSEGTSGRNWAQAADVAGNSS